MPNLDHYWSLIEVRSSAVFHKLSWQPPKTHTSAMTLLVSVLHSGSDSALSVVNASQSKHLAAAKKPNRNKLEEPGHSNWPGSFCEVKLVRKNRKTNSKNKKIKIIFQKISDPWPPSPPCSLQAPQAIASFHTRSDTSENMRSKCYMFSC